MGKAGFGLLWALATGAVLFLVGLPISLQAQLIAGSLIVAGMIILKLIRPEGVWRLISLSFGTAIVLRYVYWRTTEHPSAGQSARELHSRRSFSIWLRSITFSCSF